jgi:flagellar M-ring protein FliF
MDAMKRLFEHFYGIVGRMAPSQILLAAIVVIGMIVGTIMIVSWAKDQYFAPLYTGLSSEDAGKIVERLKELKIQYQIGDNGSSISVPSTDVYETRMKLATAGLPSPQNIGYALLDQTNIGMTDFLQKVNYRRALEGELARTITGLSEVAAARVHLVIPEDRLFREDQHQPTASVVVKLKGAMPLGKRQLQGVAYLVASSVEGMTPDRVTIIDSNGNLLSGMQASDESAMLSATQFDMRKNVEDYLEEKAQSLMSGVIGSGRAVVRVTAELNFEKSNTQIEQYDPDLVAIRSEQRTTQKGSQSEGALAQVTPTAGAAGAAGEAAGAAGTGAAATIPTTPVATNTTSDNSEDVITNYEVSKTIRNIIGEVGSIKRLTVAVMVDGAYKEAKTPEGEITKEYQARSQEELNRFAAIIKNAVGFSDARADQFEIVSLPFDNTMLETSRKELEEPSKLTTYLPYAKKIGTVLLFLVAFMYVKKKVSKMFGAIAKYVPAPPPPQPMVEAEIAAKPQKPRLIDTMKTQAKGKNDEIAKVIKTMMAEAPQ